MLLLFNVLIRTQYLNSKTKLLVGMFTVLGIITLHE